MTAIASIGTAIALLLFLALCIVGIRLRHETGAVLAPMLLAIAAILVVLVLFTLDTLESEPQTVIAMFALAAIAVACDYGWKLVATRKGRTPSGPVGSA